MTWCVVCCVFVAGSFCFSLLGFLCVLVVAPAQISRRSIFCFCFAFDLACRRCGFCRVYLPRIATVRKIRGVTSCGLCCDAFFLVGFALLFSLNLRLMPW